MYLCKYFPQYSTAKYVFLYIFWQQKEIFFIIIQILSIIVSVTELLGGNEPRHKMN